MAGPAPATGWKATARLKSLPQQAAATHRKIHTCRRIARWRANTALVRMCGQIANDASAVRGIRIRTTCGEPLTRIS